MRFVLSNVLYHGMVQRFCFSTPNVADSNLNSVSMRDGSSSNKGIFSLPLMSWIIQGYNKFSQNPGATLQLLVPTEWHETNSILKYSQMLGATIKNLVAQDSCMHHWNKILLLIVKSTIIISCPCIMIIKFILLNAHMYLTTLCYFFLIFKVY